MATKKHREAIVYAWAGLRQKVIGGRALDSSYDTYDVEYGWTAEDYRRAAGGTLVNYYTVGIGALSLNTKKDIDIAIRLDDIPNEKEGGPIILRGRGDTVVLHKSGKRLLDIGKYGIFDTLTGEKLHASPNEKDKILAYDGTEISFFEDYPSRRGKGVQKVNLEKGLRTGRFKSKEVSKEVKKVELIRKDHKEGLWRRHLTPFNFEVNGRKYTVDNRRMKDWMHVETTRITDHNQRVVLEGDPFRKYIVDAVGFPEDVLLENFPKLRGD